MKSRTVFAAMLLTAVVALGGCKRKESADRVQAGQKVEEKTGTAGEAAGTSPELEQQRRQFVNAAEQRLQQVDRQLQALTAESNVDRGRIAVLRAEAEALRAKAADPNTTYSSQYSADFDRVMNEIEAAMTPGTQGAGGGAGQGTAGERPGTGPGTMGQPGQGAERPGGQPGAEPPGTAPGAGQPGTRAPGGTMPPATPPPSGTQPTPGTETPAPGTGPGTMGTEPGTTGPGVPSGTPPQPSPPTGGAPGTELGTGAEQPGIPPGGGTGMGTGMGTGTTPSTPSSPSTTPRPGGGY